MSTNYEFDSNYNFYTLLLRNGSEIRGIERYDLDEEKTISGQFRRKKPDDVLEVQMSILDGMFYCKVRDVLGITEHGIGCRWPDEIEDEDEDEDEDADEPQPSKEG